MFNIVLYQPEIPPNTGNIIRLAANSGCHLHLVEPLGFELSDKHLQRAGLDYHDLVRVSVHRDWEHCAVALGGRRMFALTTRGGERHDRIAYAAGDVFVFGSESRGLPSELLADFPVSQRIRLPMQPTNRSVNLSNAVAIQVFEAWRQFDFRGAV